MSFGIQGRVALLVIAATVSAALIVAKVLNDRAIDVLREHETVDLGDEASLRAWTLIDKVGRLHDDLVSLAVSTEFQTAVHTQKTAAGLAPLAQSLSRQSWDQLLQIEILHLDAPDVAPLVIHQTATLANGERWFPSSEQVTRSRMHVSHIQRAHIRRTNNQGTVTDSWEPIIWAVARIDNPAEIGARSSMYIRLLMTLESTESTRHLFALFDPQGNQIVRVDERIELEKGNDPVFIALTESPELQEKLKKRNDASSNGMGDMAEPKVERLVRSDYVPLQVPYFFQEGLPSQALEEVFSGMDSDAATEFIQGLQDMIGPSARVGGILSGVREIRLLAHTRDDLNAARKKIIHSLASRDDLRGGKIRWRPLVKCDEIHSWVVRFIVGDRDHKSDYLLHYAVLDDELASSIQAEMTLVRNIALLVAAGFGLAGFLFAMHFIRPLKQMTRTAQRITDSPRESLVEEVTQLAQRLDLKRRDEIGDIARASKRLFEEIIAFQEGLEKRVAERTHELRRANIELESANDKLQTLSHEKDAFVAKVSHDLRQPLNAIFLQVEALKLSPLDDMQKKDVQRIRDHAARELTLVNDILEYQKIIMGAESLHKNTIEIAPLLDDLATTQRAFLADKSLELIELCPEEIGSFVADERRLRQILGNLLSNSAKFTKEGSITLAARPQKVKGVDWIEFTVTDTGRGMSPSEQEKVFTPFVSNKKDNAGGTGLGLSICRELTVQMGGRIGFVSELDKGTHFCLMLPRVPTSERYDSDKRDLGALSKGPASALPPALPQQSDAGDSVQKPGKEAWDKDSPKESSIQKGTILVIDDDENTRQLLHRLLESNGYGVILAEDGSIGLHMANLYRPDAITLDVVMPGGIDGWEVLRRLKEATVTQSIPVIMVSLMVEEDHAMALGVEDYLVKPIDVKRLSRAIARATHRAPQRNLLLVDDDVDALSTMARLLEADGWHTLSATNGALALTALTKTRPAAIILDLTMPEMDGFEFLQHLRSDPDLGAIPVIIMSAKDPTEAERHFLEKRVEVILQKGTHSYSDLLRTIDATLGNGG